MTLHPLLLPCVVSRTAGGICILPQLCSDHSCESAAGFQHALSQGSFNQSPLSKALPNNLLSHGALSKMWEKYLWCSLLQIWSLKLQLSLIPTKCWQITFGSARLAASQLFLVHPCSNHLWVHLWCHSWEQITHLPDSTGKKSHQSWEVMTVWAQGSILLLHRGTPQRLHGQSRRLGMGKQGEEASQEKSREQGALR